MAIAAKISPAELTAQVTNRFVNKYYECRLINAPGTAYTPGTTNDATFLGFEVAAGTGGYQRQVIRYVAGDVSSYSDDGVALATKATTFTHNGGGTALQFSHAALVDANGCITAFGSITGKPTSGINGTYTNLPLTTAQSGIGATANLTITSNGAANGNWALSINKFGYNYAAGNTLQIPESTLVSAGAAVAGVGALTFTVGSVYTSSSQLLAVAQTANTVSLTGGNQTVFYWNLKQFGFYSV